MTDYDRLEMVVKGLGLHWFRGKKKDRELYNVDDYPAPSSPGMLCLILDNGPGMPWWRDFKDSLWESVIDGKDRYAEKAFLVMSPQAGIPEQALSPCHKLFDALADFLEARDERD